MMTIMTARQLLAAHTCSSLVASLASARSLRSSRLACRRRQQHCAASTPLRMRRKRCLQQ